VALLGTLAAATAGTAAAWSESNTAHAVIVAGVVWAGAIIGAAHLARRASLAVARIARAAPVARPGEAA
jgi:hypothetical protein